jgi:hypothetical protein
MGDETARECPPWVDGFTAAVGCHIETGAVPFAYDVWDPDDRGEPEGLDDPWEVHFYPSVSEVVGGPRDGALVYPGLVLDLVGVLDLFDEIDGATWSGRIRNRVPRYRGGVVEVSGWFAGHPVRLCVFERPPDDATAETTYDHDSGRVRPRDRA